MTSMILIDLVVPSKRLLFSRVLSKHGESFISRLAHVSSTEKRPRKGGRRRRRRRKKSCDITKMVEGEKFSYYRSFAFIRREISVLIFEIAVAYMTLLPR